MTRVAAGSLRVLGLVLGLGLAACVSSGVDWAGGGAGEPIEPNDAGQFPESGVNVGGSPCPATPPSSGACSLNGALCLYGDDPRPECRTLSTCTNGVWLTLPPAKCGALVCPPTPPITGATCSDPGGSCARSSGVVCACVPLPASDGGAAGVWSCSTPPATQGCPAIVPNLGVACAPEGLACDYGGCDLFARVVCQAGYWQTAPSSCGGP